MDEELQILFHAIDSVPANHEAPNRELIVPVLFRMMFCCGMRPAEPLHLKREDVDLSSGDILVRESKRKKDRHITMSDDLLNLCRKYDTFIGVREWFFQKWDGGPFPTYWMRNQFRICWRNSELLKRGNPRPYDLRHNFATRTLMRWVDEGKDVMALLPYLSAYMGHNTLRIPCITSTYFRSDCVQPPALTGKNSIPFTGRLKRMKTIKNPDLFQKIRSL
jgi:integrase